MCGECENEVSWFAGKLGDTKSCDMVCEEHGKICNVDALQIPNASALQKLCDEFLPGNNGVAEGNLNMRPMIDKYNTNMCWGYGYGAGAGALSCHHIPGCEIIGGIDMCEAQDE